MKRNIVGLFVILLNCCVGVLSAKDYMIKSPDGNIVMTISVNNSITWSTAMNGQQVFENNVISLTIDGDKLGVSPQLIKKKRHCVSEYVGVSVPVKSSSIKNEYNELVLDFEKNFSLCFRVFDNGVAYRFETNYRGEVKVSNEELKLNFAGDYSILFPEEETLLSHYERYYLDDKLSAFSAGRFCSLPALVKGDHNINIGITEADLYDYPCLFLETTGTTSLRSKFPKVILETVPKGDRDIIVKKEANYVAKTQGTRVFPWRVFMMSDNDCEIVENQMVYLLSRADSGEDFSWVKPGLVAWDWWNDNNLTGVDFKAGINNETYKYYIDFAAKHGLPYVILDEGWSKTTTNVLESCSDIDIPELVAYGKAKQVDLILWSLWGPVNVDMINILDRFKAWGIKGIKVDFMAQGDQGMVDFYERLAKACASRHLLVDFHGAFKPAGLRRAYPNVLNYEGVKGLENDKWSDKITPEHDVTLPFTRMLAGPLDYTPGAMCNAHPKDFAESFTNPMSIGTRCHQLSMYIIYDAPLQMLSDSPTNYEKESEAIQFISRMKTVWDETRVLQAKIADYIVTARRSGDNWYIGAMTDFDARTLELDLSFLGDGEYLIDIMQDGINADRAAMDFQYISKRVTKDSKLSIPMVSGGGWAAICTKQ